VAHGSNTGICVGGGGAGSAFIFAITAFRAIAFVFAFTAAIARADCAAWLGPGILGPGNPGIPSHWPPFCLRVCLIL